MTLIVHRAARTDVLADALAEELLTPSSDPLALELVVVPAKGVERWLSQRLSLRLGRSSSSVADGVCAGIEFAQPRSLMERVIGADAEDPYSPDNLAWPLVRTLDRCLTEPWAAPLADHLGAHLDGEQADVRRGRRYPLARRLAWLFHQYAVQRPSLLLDWSAGGSTDGCGRPLPADLAWQPPLWRAVTAELAGVPTPAERHQSTLRMLRDQPEQVELPARVSLFGHTRIAASEIALLEALGEHRDVHLWLPHPSPTLWQRLSAEVGVVARDEDTSHVVVDHPLLATLGHDTRELQRLIQGATTRLVPEPEPPAAASLLAQLQADLRANRPPTPHDWTPDDRSIQVHACHGVARQVEVAREAIMGLLADDETLEPRDIIVMCPDIDTFAPLIGAAFGAVDTPDEELTHPAHHLAVRLADRGTSHTNELVGVALRLLDLAGSRTSASAVLDFAALPVVRRRFGFTDDHLERLTTWVGQAGVRWGFDAEHRAEFGLESFVHNTWRFGLDRLLAGVAMSEDSHAWLGQTLPLDDVSSSDIDVVGRLTEFVQRLVTITDDLVGAHPAQHWLATLADGVEALSATSPADAWMLGQLQREFGEIREQADSTELRLTEIRALLTGRTAGRPTRTNFRSGTLTVCTMVPMRSVPHRVVVLLGLDDGVFPRQASLDGDDVLLRHPLTGERDPRNEDRQLFLDAILAADDHLVITFNGANEFTGQPRPPAVPLGEFLDTLALTARLPDGRSATSAIVTRHPLQPFDPRNHTSGALGPGVFSFDPTSLAGARAIVAPRVAPAGGVAEPLPPAPLRDLTVADLLEFARSPVRHFLRSRLDVALAYDSDEINDALPVEINALGQWSVGDRLLRDLLDGRAPQEAMHAEWRRGVLPPGRLGWRQLQAIAAKAAPLADHGRRVRAGDRAEPRRARTLDVDIDLPGGRRLRGTVPQMYGDLLVPVAYSRLSGGHRLASWVQVVALTVHDPARNFRAHTIGRATNSRATSPYAESILGPLDHTAHDILLDLVALRDRALNEALPLPIKTSFRYATARRTHAEPEQALDAARKVWEGNDIVPGERNDAEFGAVWGQAAAVPGVSEPPQPGEEFPGETTRFGALAMRLWTPLMRAEVGGW